MTSSPLTLIHNLATLKHFDQQGRLLHYNNISLLINQKKILKDILDQQQAEKLLKSESISILDGSFLLGLPLLIDCHSHSLFAGNRAQEFIQKTQGASYQEIAQAGGGILFTQKQTAQASDEELAQLLRERISCFQAQGVFGIEVKSGYGLTHDEEIRHLRIIQKVKQEFKGKCKIWVTYMGPHALLSGVDKDNYLREICSKTLPLIAQKQLADFVDIFVDKGFFTKEDMRTYFQAATKLGFKLKAHIDEIENLGAAELCEEFTITSVDHCTKTTPQQLEKLKVKNVSVVFLPLTSYYLKEETSTMEELRKIGLKPALSLDYNPGSQPGLSFPLLWHMAFRRMKMNEDEALESMTVQALKALAEPLDQWCLEKGQPLKLALFKAGSVAELGYRYGENLFQQSFF